MTALQTLLTLDEIFTADALLAHGLASESQANTWLMRATEGGYIVPAGVHSGVYYNLMKDPQGPQRRRLQVVQLLYPTSVLVGPSALDSGNLATESGQSVDVAILKRPTTRTIDGVNIVMRENSWYRVHEPRFIAAQNALSLPRLTPADAILDANTSGDWGSSFESRQFGRPARCCASP